MKRFLTTVLAASLMLIGTNAFAQLSVAAGFGNSQTKFDINVLNVIKTSHNANLNGFYAGASYNIPVGTSGLGIAPGVYFAYMTDKDVDIYVASGDIVESYLEIPLDLNLKFPIADGLNGVIYAGPTFAYGYDFGLLNRGGSTVGVHRNQLHAGVAFMF